MALGVGDRAGQSILPRRAGGELVGDLTRFIGVQRPLLHRGFLGLAKGIVGDFEQPHPALASHALAIQGARGEGGLGHVAHGVIAAMGPGVHLERLPRHQDLAAAGDGAARAVGDFHADGVFVVLIPVGDLGEGGIDHHLEFPIRPDLRLGVGHQFRRLRGRRPPPGQRAQAAPVAPAGVPGVVVGEPPVTRPVEPVPGHRGKPAGVVRGAVDLDLDATLFDRPAKVILGLDRGGDGLAQHDRFGRGVHLHLKFRLLVLLHPEILPGAIIDQQRVGAQGSAGGQGQGTGDPAKAVGHQGFLVHILALGVDDANRQAGAREGGLVLLVKLARAAPDLELHALSGAIDRAVGDDEILDLVVLRLVLAVVPHAPEPQPGQAALGGGGGDQVLRHLLARLELGVGGNGLPLGVGLQGEAGGAHIRPAPGRGLGQALLPVTKIIQVGPGHRLAGARVGHEGVHAGVGLAFLRQRLLHDHRVADPEHDEGFIAILDFATHQIGPGLLEGGLHVEHPVKMPGPGSQFLRPLRHLVAEVLLVVFRNDAPADALDLGAIPAQVAGIVGQVFLHVLQQGGHLDGMRLEGDLGGVAVLEAKPGLAGGRAVVGLELPPVAHDLSQLLARPLVALVILQVLAPVLRRRGILAAVGENVRESAVIHQLGEQLDEIVLGRQGEAFDPGGQAGDGFVGLEGVQFPGPALVLLVLVHALEKPVVGLQGLHPVLPAQVLGVQAGAPLPAVIGKRGAALQRPAPARAVVGGGGPAFRHPEEYRIALFVHRSALLASAMGASLPTPASPPASAFIVG